MKINIMIEAHLTELSNAMLTFQGKKSIFRSSLFRNKVTLGQATDRHVERLREH